MIYLLSQRSLSQLTCKHLSLKYDWKNVLNKYLLTDFQLILKLYLEKREYLRIDGIYCHTGRLKLMRNDKRRRFCLTAWRIMDKIAIKQSHDKVFINGISYTCDLSHLESLHSGYYTNQ